MKGLIWAFVIVLLSFQALAIGIAPGKVEIVYKPGEVHTQTITLINNELKESHVMLYVDEQYSGMVDFGDKVVDFKDESNKKIEVTITMPAKMDYGPHTISLIATEFPFKQEELSGVGSLKAVVSQLIIDVPYPGKYIDAEFLAVAADSSEPIAFLLKAKNKGKEDIFKVSAEIKIYGPTNELISTVATDTKQIKAGEMRELSAMYHHSLKPGTYYAKAFITYDDTIVQKELTFELGDKTIKIVEITSEPFKLGEIAKFQVWLSNNWNEVITDVYSDFIVKDEYGKTLTSYTTSKTEIPPFSSKALPVFWDTKGVSEGVYPGKVVVHYLGENIEQNMNINVEKDKINTDFTKKETGNVVTGGSSLLSRDLTIILLVIASMILNTFLIIHFVRKKS